MKTALGPLGWSPEQFWAAGMCEFMAALEGYNEANNPAPPPAMTRARLKELMEKYPDG